MGLLFSFCHYCNALNQEVRRWLQWVLPACIGKARHFSRLCCPVASTRGTPVIISPCISIIILQVLRNLYGEVKNMRRKAEPLISPACFLEGAVCTEHRGTLTLGTHVPASPSRCVGSSLPLFSAKPFRFLTLSCHRFPLGAFCPSHHGSDIGVQRHNLIRRSQSAIISGL